jgi:hypothetical protein
MGQFRLAQIQWCTYRPSMTLRIRLFQIQAGPENWRPSNAFRLNSIAEERGWYFRSFDAARRYADAELAFGEPFAIVHVPRGGTWRGHAGIPGQTFELPTVDFGRTHLTEEAK